jgi:Flp pilus assembly pilin Flp
MVLPEVIVNHKFSPPENATVALWPRQTAGLEMRAILAFLKNGFGAIRPEYLLIGVAFSLAMVAAINVVASVLIIH